MKRVLIAEDSATSRLLAAALLEEAGFETLEATDGNEAVSIWESGSVDFILMDVQMPNLDGCEATSRIRAAEGSSEHHIPIIAMTADSETESARCLASGMDACLPKPLNLDELNTALSAIGG